MPNIHAPAELFGLARHVDALALRVVEPAVVAAAQPFLLDAAPLEAGVAVRTMRLERTDAPLLVTEDREMLRHVAGALTGLASIGCGLVSPGLAQAPQRRREVVVNGKARSDRRPARPLSHAGSERADGIEGAAAVSRDLAGTHQGNG